jgi:hypothetical protein
MYLTDSLAQILFAVDEDENEVNNDLLELQELESQNQYDLTVPQIERLEKLQKEKEKRERKEERREKFNQKKEEITNRLRDALQKIKDD